MTGYRKIAGNVTDRAKEPNHSKRSYIYCKHVGIKSFMFGLGWHSQYENTKKTD